MPVVTDCRQRHEPILNFSAQFDSVFDLRLNSYQTRLKLARRQCTALITCGRQRLSEFCVHSYSAIESINTLTLLGSFLEVNPDYLQQNYGQKTDFAIFVSLTLNFELSTCSSI